MIHFKTQLQDVRQLALDGSNARDNSQHWWRAPDNTMLEGHTANLPQTAFNMHYKCPNPSLALAQHTMYRPRTYDWNIRAEGNRHVLRRARQ